MHKSLFVLLLLFVSTEAFSAPSCKTLFDQSHKYYQLGKNIQINILDLAQLLAVYPYHKGMGSEWSRYAVGRYNIDPDILRLGAKEVSELSNPVYKDYAERVLETFYANFKQGIPDDRALSWQTIGAPEISITIIFSQTRPLAAKVSYSQKMEPLIEINNPAEKPWSASGYFDAQANVIKTDKSL